MRTLILTKFALLAAFAAITPAKAQQGTINFAMDIDEIRSMSRQLAFEPNRFFPDQYARPFITIRYTGDDYGYPVYSLAVRRGCTVDDKGEARKSCGSRMTARIVRAPGIIPEAGEGRSRRIAGAKIFAYLYENCPEDEVELRAALDSYGLEWLEADVTACPAAIAHLLSAEEISFFAEPALPDDSLSIVLHADKIDFTFGDYLTRSRYRGFVKRGSPGEWADQFAASLSECWKPATATVPWRLESPAEQEIDPLH